jgi:hypothetical protein
MKPTNKLNYYYVPVKMRYKLTKSVEPVIPIATDNDFMIDLFFGDGTTDVLCCGVNGTTKVVPTHNSFS